MIPDKFTNKVIFQVELIIVIASYERMVFKSLE